MRLPRAAGLLLHPTSLPGIGGIGSAGPEARRFVDTLVAAGMGLWQVLPLGPTGYADSPYASFSAFAGNPLLLSLELLRDQGLLTEAEIAAVPVTPETYVDYGMVIPAKMSVLRHSFERFQARPSYESALHEFAEANAFWLESYVLFMALKDAHGGAPWYEWELALRRRDSAALDAARAKLAPDISFHRYLQFQFFNQWAELKSYANGQNVHIIGDIPIFVAYDSADVWANQDLFLLDPEGVPTVVAGVPPDYFSSTGQLWGNPHYRWDVMEERGYHWWIERFRVLLRLVDIVRLDHFRGFAGAWQVPFGDKTAERGEWVPGPGLALFRAVLTALGSVSIIAEDLGVITPDVVALREELDLPGMHILQFAFDSPANPSLPHNLPHYSAVYTGTHDNDTTVGWFMSIPEGERAFVLRYLGTQGLDISWDMIRAAMASVADLAIAPLQDVLRLGTKARMNLPGRMEGNWKWRFTPTQVSEADVWGLRMLSETYGRLPPAGGVSAGTPQ